MNRVLVLGDSGVGKTSFVHLMSYGYPLDDPEWTVGCCVDLKIVGNDKHGEPCFVEFIDVGCHRNFEGSRSIYYEDIDAIILVYDLTNLKSFANLRKFVLELRNYFQENANRNEQANLTRTVSNGQGSIAGYPVLVVGNKLDLVRNFSISRLPDVRKTLGFDSVIVSSANGSSDAVDMFLQGLVHPASPSTFHNYLDSENSNRRSTSTKVKDSGFPFDMPSSMFNIFTARKNEELLPTIRR